MASVIAPDINVVRLALLACQEQEELVQVMVEDFLQKHEIHGPAEIADVLTSVDMSVGHLKKLGILRAIRNWEAAREIPHARLHSAVKRFAEDELAGNSAYLRAFRPLFIEMLLLFSETCLADDLRFMIALHRHDKMNPDLLPQVQVAIARAAAKIDVSAPRTRSMIEAECASAEKYLQDADLRKDEKERLTEHLDRLGRVLGVQIHATDGFGGNRAVGVPGIGAKDGLHVEVVADGHRIAFLSDLHISDVDGQLSWKSRLKRAIPGFRSFVLRQKNVLAEGFPSENTRKILGRLAELRVSHVLVAGDVSNCGLPEQFQHARTLFLSLQNRLQNDITKSISPGLFTILPGNHDVSGYSNKSKFRLFWEYFQDSFDNNKATEFPHKKIIYSPSQLHPMEIDIVCLDSCRPRPVYLLDATGVVAKPQLAKLKMVLQQKVNDRRCRLVILHHHPILQPAIANEVVVRRNRLEEDGAHNLISFCLEHGVAGILHGHNHTFRLWYSPQERDGVGVTPVTIVGAPCGTMGDVGDNVQFLELRQIFSYRDGQRIYGLGLWRHRLRGDSWVEPEDLCTCIFP